MNSASSRPILTAYIALAVGILCLGFSGIFVRWANAPGAVAGFFRMGIAVLALAWPFWRRFRRTSLPRREIAVALAGGLFFAIDLALWNTGILLGGATLPTLMANTAPLWVGLGALLFFHERLNRAFWLGLAITFIGAAVVMGLTTVGEVSLGSLLGLLAGIFYAGYFLLTQRGRQKLDTNSYTWLAATSSTVVLFIASLLFDQPLTGYSSSTYLNFLAMGLVVQVIGYLAFTFALGYLPASLVSPTALLQPVLTAILAGPLLDEHLSPLQLAGGTIVLGGVLLVHQSRSRRRRAVARQATSE